MVGADTVDLTHLRRFVLLAEVGNLGRAARKLGISQQAMSSSMTSLEESIGMRLLHRGRGRRSVELTVAGTVFLDGARDVVSRFDDVLERLEGMRHRTHIG
jgi:DNA-binding transcriptional LysR family regulator